MVVSIDMARRRSSIGLFGVFGRSGDLRQLDQALRSVDVHPRLVPEAVKLTVVNLLRTRPPAMSLPLNPIAPRLNSSAIA